MSINIDKIENDVNNSNIEFLVDKYIPNNIDDIFEKNIFKDDKEDENIFNLKYNNAFNKLNEDPKYDNWVYNSYPSKCYFHREIYKKLKNISEDDGLPHIIFYGNQGSGKKTMINLFLEMIYDKSIYKLDDSKYTVISSGNIENEVIVKQSDHHIIIEPNNNNFDRYLIQDIVKEYAKKYPLTIFEKNRTFKTVQINYLDNLSYYAQTSLRRTIEKYSKTCRFVMWCYSLSKVIEPLRSRCLCIHVPTQTNDELIKWIFNISVLENIKITPAILNKILDTSNGNLKDILWKLDLYKNCNKVDNAYKVAINALIDEIKGDGDIQTIRDYIYKMMITNITSNTIIKDILNIILQTTDNLTCEQRTEIIKNASEYEYRLSKGRRDIIHIEAFIISIILIINTKQD